MSTDDAKPLVETEYKSVKFSLADALRQGVEASGKSYVQMVTEIARGSFGDNMLTAEEYFWHRLHTLDLDAEELAQFAGSKRSGSSNFLCNDMQWVAICADKLIFMATLSALGFPVPKPVALAHATRVHRALPLLDSIDALGEWLRTAAPYPVFGKPLEGIHSVGTSSLQAYHQDKDELEDLYGRRFPAQRLLSELEPFVADGYLFQERLNPHPEVAERCGPALSTLRVVVLQDEQGAEVMDVAFKMAVDGQIADNFWRGNLVGGVRLQDGKIERVLTAPGLDGRRLAEHPDTGAELVGWHLPDWDLLKETVCDATEALPGLGLLGWDVALTDQGPVLVEANVSNDWAMVQLAAARGLWRGRLKRLAQQRFSEWKVKRKQRKMDFG